MCSEGSSGSFAFAWIYSGAQKGLGAYMGLRGFNPACLEMVRFASVHSGAPSDRRVHSGLRGYTRGVAGVIRDRVSLERS